MPEGDVLAMRSACRADRVAVESRQDSIGCLIVLWDAEWAREYGGFAVVDQEHAMLPTLRHSRTGKDGVYFSRCFQGSPIQVRNVQHPPALLAFDAATLVGMGIWCRSREFGDSFLDEVVYGGEGHRPIRRRSHPRFFGFNLHCCM